MKANNKNHIVKNENQLSESKKIEDFNYMYNILKYNYPYFEVNKRKHNIDWLSNKAYYLSKIKSTKDDLSFYNILKDILADLNNGYTVMLDKAQYNEDKKIYEKDNEIAYIAIKSFNTFNIDNDMKLIKPFLISCKNYKAIIINIRSNTGGDTSYWADDIVPMLIINP